MWERVTNALLNLCTLPHMVVFDPADVLAADDPVPLYAAIREQAPVHHSPRGFWVVAGHADCLSVLRDRRASSDGTNIDPAHLPEGFMTEGTDAIGEMIQQAEQDNRPFLFRDPPDHTRLRGLVSKAFTPRTVESLRARTSEVVAGLLDRALDDGEVDLVSSFAYPLPVQIICDLLGIPAEDQYRFHGWSAALARGLDPDFLLPPGGQEERMQAVLSFAQYFFPLLAERRQHPGEDLLSQLALAEDGGDTLSEGEMLSTCILLLVAGHETTVNLIAGGILALLRHPDQFEALRRQPELARPGVEELLRYVSPVQLTGRTLLDDMEVGGVTLPGGQFAMLLLAAANRDPAVFDRPDELRLDRADNRHLGFGFGAHHCLGAPLARLEAQVALSELARRTRSLELRTETPRYRDTLILRGLEELPVSLVAA